MNEEIQKQEELQGTGNVPKEIFTTTADIPETEAASQAPEENDTDTVSESTEVLPELPTVSANDIPSVLPALPVEPSQNKDISGNFPAQSSQDGNFSADIPTQPQTPVASLLENAENLNEILSVVRELAETVNTQAEPSGLPISGYEDYSYPVSVVYRIFPPALGSETGYSGTYSDPETFNAAYQNLQADVQAGSLSYCYVRYVYDASGECVYDAEAYSQLEEPDVPEAPDETMLSILEVLENIETDMQSSADTDAAFRTEMMLLQEQNAELRQEMYTIQLETVVVQKECLASSLAIGFVLILTFGYIVAHGFFQRMKVG